MLNSISVAKLTTTLQEFSLNSHQMDATCRVLPNSLLGKLKSLLILICTNVKYHKKVL